MDNAPIYYYSKEVITSIVDQNINLAGKVYGVVVEALESLKQIFGVEQIPFNVADMFCEVPVKSNDGDVALRVAWNITNATISLMVINVADGLLLGTANLRVASNRFNESFDRFKDADLKAKVNVWFDTLSRIDITTVQEYGHLYQQNDEAPAPTAPTSTSAPAEAPSEVLHVDAEIVSEG